VHAIHGRATELSGTVELDVVDGRAGGAFEPEVTVRIRLVAEPA
jgi:hypothetical protein